MNETTLLKLKADFGKNKIIPAVYEEPILVALSHYSELKDTAIEFKLVQKQSVAYRSTPVFRTIFNRAGKRRYRVSILEQAQPPLQMALLKYCPPETRAGVIGHELAHVLQYERMKRPRLLRFLFLYLLKSARRKIERGADQLTVFHGLGHELFLHACYIRSIPGYLRERPSLDSDYLKPMEIMAYLANQITLKKI